MNRVIFFILVAGLFAGAGIKAAEAQEKPFGLSLNLGVQMPVGSEVNGDGPWLSLDARLDFRLSKSFEFGPELMTVFSAHGQYYYPGLMLNLTLKRLFFGAGVVVPLWTGEGASLWSDEGNGGTTIAPRIHAGYRFGKLLVTAHFIAFTEVGNTFLGMGCCGATLGYQF